MAYNAAFLQFTIKTNTYNRLLRTLQMLINITDSSTNQGLLDSQLDSISYSIDDVTHQLSVDNCEDSVRVLNILGIKHEPVSHGTHGPLMSKTEPEQFESLKFGIENAPSLISSAADLTPDPSLDELLQLNDDIVKEIIKVRRAITLVLADAKMKLSKGLYLRVLLAYTCIQIA